jgi:GNAT superfamily N-acetyltransferase
MEAVMSTVHDRASTIRIVRQVLAADCACPETGLIDEDLLITHAEERVGRRRYPLPAKPLLAMTMGAGVVVTCHPERAGWLRATLEGRSRDAIFSAPTIAELAQYVARDGQELRGPACKYICAPETFRPPADPAGVLITLVEGEAVAELYRHEGFGNALAYCRDRPRPDVAAAVGSCAGTVLGIAGISADCEALWQIGVDIVPAAQGAGLGRALVGRLTEHAFDHGKIPYYATAVSNVRSAALAVGLGYWPAWTEFSAKDLAPTTERCRRV